EQLTVVNDDDGAIFIPDGLPAVEEADDAEPSVGESQAGLLEKAVFIRAAVDDRIGHARQSAVGQRALALQIDHARNAAHESAYSPVRARGPALQAEHPTQPISCVRAVHVFG